MATEKGDLPRFYAQVSQLAKLPKLERDQALAAALVANQTTLAAQPPLTAKP
jgi:predicted aminopeptidase